MTTIPTIVVHGGAGTYATIIQDFHAKKDIENGTSASASAEYSLVPSITARRKYQRGTD